MNAALDAHEGEQNLAAALPDLGEEELSFLQGASMADDLLDQFPEAHHDEAQGAEPPPPHQEGEQLARREAPRVLVVRLQRCRTAGTYKVAVSATQCSTAFTN